MSLTSDEQPMELEDALIAFTGCVGEALADICSYGWTIGDTYIPFDPDDEDECDEGEAACSQAWVRVMNVNSTGSSEDSFGGEECSSELRIEIEVGVTRCFGIVEEGEAPTASAVLIAAAQSMADMKAVYCAAMNCEVWSSIDSGQWTPSGPMGGQYGGTWTFTVTVL